MAQEKVYNNIFPWYSREEWMEVYSKSFSTDMQHWREAHNQMCVWKARVQRLPLGIECTLLLLSARITEFDSKTRDTEKGIIISSAISRFVSLVVKVPQKNIHSAMPMHIMAEELGLPKHLVDLRHEIVHASDVPIHSTTLRLALNTAWDWLKEFYWIPEEKKFITELSDDPMQENIEESLSLLTPFLDDLDALVRRLYPQVPQNNTEMGSTQIGQAIARTVSHYYSTYPLESLKAIVDHLLVVKEPPIIRAAAVSKHSCPCGSTLMPRVVQGVRWILIALHKLQALPRLIQYLLEENTIETSKCHDLANEWICVILSFLLGAETVGWKHCADHSIHVAKARKVDYRWLVQVMLDKEDNKTTKLAFKIMENRDEFSKEEIEELRHLVAIRFGTLSATNDCSGDDSDHDHDTIYGIEHIVDKAREISYGEGKSTEMYRDIIFGNFDEQLYDSSKMRKPLGILPGQKDQPNFYKDLLLDYTSCNKDMEI